MATVICVIQASPAFSLGLGGVFGGIVHQGERAAEQAVFEQIAKGLSDVEPPIKLDQRTAYPAVQVDNFQPQQLEFNSVQDWLQPLAPGDYWVDLLAFCTEWSIHSPGAGMAYKLAPLQGKAADIVSAIFFRGALHDVAPAELQAMAWRIQAGVSINQWSDSEKELVHQLIPEYESRLTSDFLDELKAKYNSFQGNVPLHVFPSFDDALGRLGETGRIIASIQRARQTLMQQNIAADQLPELLYEHTDGTAYQLPGLATPEPVQWNEVKPGLYASFVVEQGNLGTNRLNIRVTPQAVQASNPQGIQVASIALAPAPALAPVAVTVLDAVGTFLTDGAVVAAANDNLLLETLVNSPQGRMTLGRALLILSESELLVTLEGLNVVSNIGYAIGQRGAQALVNALRKPQKQDEPDCSQINRNPTQPIQGQATPNSGNLDPREVPNFQDGKYTEIKTSEWVRLWRVWGGEGKAEEIGGYWTRTPITPEQLANPTFANWIRNRLAVQHPWNDINQVTVQDFRPDTTMYVGNAEANGPFRGQGQQIYLDKTAQARHIKTKDC